MNPDEVFCNASLVLGGNSFPELIFRSPPRAPGLIMCIYEDRNYPNAWRWTLLAGPPTPASAAI